MQQYILLSYAITYQFVPKYINYQPALYFIIKSAKNKSMRKQSSSEDESQNQSSSIELAHLAPKQQSLTKKQVVIKSRNSQKKIKSPQKVIQTPAVINQVQAPRLIIPNQSKPRLIIDKIVLENFKSYADKIVIGPFDQNFTCIVGPNGSGKSNLIQSMLFIFGYKANWMRLNRLNQLIHNSSTMMNIEKASVQVFFRKVIEIQTNDGLNQETKIVRVPNSEFSIRRIVRSSGVSKYYINENESTQGQVKDRLQEEGIDLNNNRFLILQGEVEQISQMKQKSGDRQKPGLLQYLEDIIGSNIFIQKIEEATAEYETMEQLKQQKGEKMKVSELQLKNMNKGKQQAIKYVKKQRQIYQIHNILQQVIRSNAQYNKTNQQKQLRYYEQQKERIINEEKQKLKKQSERIKEIKRIRGEIQVIEKQLHKDKQNMDKLNNIDKNINQQISFKSEDLVKFNRKVNEYDNELAKIISESNEVKEILPGLKDKLSKLHQQVEDIQKELEKHDKPELKQKAKQLQNELKKMQHEIKIYFQKEKQTKKVYDLKYKKTEKNEILELQLQKKLSQESETIQKIAQAQIEATKIKDSLSKDLEAISAARKQAIGELQKISLQIREQQHQSKEIGLFNDIFEKIMQQNIPGVVGRLGDLGSVSKQYDQIITTCCGRLDNIVVRDMEAATSVLNFLKINKLGRMTCIILDKIEQFRKNMERQWTNKPNSIRLFDMIRPVSEQARMAFYFAISDTIYCQNSQLGMQYSMKDDNNRRRVISKKANGYIIFQLNGLMNGCTPKQGGFTVKAKNRNRLKGQTDGQVKQLQKAKIQWNQKIARLQQRYRTIKKQYESVTKDLQEFKRQKANVEHVVSQTKMELHQLQKVKKERHSSHSDASKLQRQIQSIGKKLQQLHQQKSIITNNLSKLEQQQSTNQSSTITKLRNNYKIIKQQHNVLEKDIQKKVIILETTLKRVEENKKNKNDMSKKIDMLNKQIKKLEKQRDDVETKGVEIINRVQKNEEKVSKLKKQEDSLKLLFQDQEKEVRQSKIKIDKAKQQVESRRFKVQEFTRIIRQAEQQLKKQRDTYRQLSSSYDFIEDLDSIQQLNIQQIKKNTGMTKGDTSVILNQSIDSNNTSMTKIFPLQRLLQTSPFEDLSEDRLDGFLLFADKMRTMLVTQNENLKKMSGNNIAIISQFRQKFSQFKRRHEQYEAVRLSQIQLRKKIDQYKETRLKIFREGFGIINSKLKEVYQYITRGGDAELQLIDILDPFADGINFSVRPPKKTWKQINKLSGGEKTLSSLSLIFALHYFKPTPLYFMDEIDAALDYKNVSIVAQYVKKRTKNAQFIIISLRNNMFQLSNLLIGVYKTFDKTKSVKMDFSKNLKGRNKDKENQNKNKS